MTIGGLFRHLEMGIYLIVFRGAAFAMSIKRLVQFAASLARRFAPATSLADLSGTEVGRAGAQAKQAAQRASRLVPGAACLHRALATRVWLARRGIASQLVVGFQKEGDLAGHAWLELDEGETLFDEEGYRASFRESDLIPEEPAEPSETLDSDKSGAERIADSGTAD